MDHGGLDFGSSRVALYSELVRGILDLSSTALTLACLASDFKIWTSGQMDLTRFRTGLGLSLIHI